MRSPVAVETDPAPASIHSDDGLLNKFQVVTLTALRARQLQNGARPRVDGGAHKLLQVARLEVMAGMISWEVGPRKGEERTSS